MKRGTPSHPKLLELARVLKISRPTAVGTIELLWQFTAQYTPAGDIGRYSDERIAAAVDWRRKPETLISSMVTTGWLNHSEGSRLVVLRHWIANELTRTATPRANDTACSLTAKSFLRRSPLQRFRLQVAPATEGEKK